MIAQEQGRDDASSLQPVNEQASLFPFPNRTSFELLDWFWRDGDKKTQENFGHLVDILKSDKFSQEDLWETSWESIHRSLAADDPDSAEWEDAGSSGWRTTPVSINVPLRQVAHEGPHMFNAGSVHYRPLVSMILDKLNDSHSHQFFHYEPYTLHWERGDESTHQQVHGELYSSKAFLEAHRQIQNLPGEAGCNRPRVVIALMAGSDASHLAQFGDAKMWPLYMFYGNESKYRRSRPTMGLCEHVAYFCSVRT